MEAQYARNGYPEEETDFFSIGDVNRDGNQHQNSVLNFIALIDDEQLISGADNLNKLELF